MDIRKTLETIYLDWYNNYLTVECFAEHNGLTNAQAATLINLARDVANSEHPDN